MNIHTTFSNDGLKKTNATNDLRRTIPNDAVKTVNAAHGIISMYRESACCGEPVVLGFCIMCRQNA